MGLHFIFLLLFYMWFLDNLRYTFGLYTPEQKAELERGIEELENSRSERIAQATQEGVLRTQSRYLSEKQRLEDLDKSLSEQTRAIAEVEIAKMYERIDNNDELQRRTAEMVENLVRKKLKDLDK